MPRVLYSPRYNIGFFGLERLHPFDSRKYGRVWRLLQKHFGRRLNVWRESPRRAIGREELLRVHSAQYLQKLRDPVYVSRALEVPLLARAPAWLIDWCVLLPMRWATAGTIAAARAALRHGFAVNLGGGYHHAQPERGEGFSIYSDIGLAIERLRDENFIGPEARVAYIDLDVHQGNGVCRVFADDPRVFIFDLYNREIYPQFDAAVRSRIDCDLGVTSGCDDSRYRQILRDRLPGFLDNVGRARPIEFAIYNAGTDIVAGDPLGDFQVSPAGVLDRDLFVVDELRRRNIPTVMLLSGGYTRQSYEYIAASVIRLLEQEETREKAQ